VLLSSVSALSLCRFGSSFFEEEEDDEEEDDEH
jgi:hypothetical protein